MKVAFACEIRPQPRCYFPVVTARLDYRSHDSIGIEWSIPQFIGSTGGLLNAAETEEKYAITWTSNSAQAFELPTVEQP